MIAEISEIEEIVWKHGLTCPECGSYEASFEAFADWYEKVKDRPSGVTGTDGKPVHVRSFDVASLLGDFDCDLQEYAFSTQDKGGSR